MKNLLQSFIAILSFTLVLNACSSDSKPQEEISNKGKVTVENGKSEKDTISMTCTGCKEHLQTKKLFDRVVNHAVELTKNQLKFPLSYLPENIELTVIKEDRLIDVESNKPIKDVLQVISEVKYVAKNGYGNELNGEAVHSFYLQNEEFIDLKSRIKLPKLAFEKGYINRDLNCFSDDTDYITFTPLQDKSIIVKSNLSCVEEGSIFQITLEGGDKIEIKSWNDFNCDGTSYFYWFSAKDIEKLKSSKVVTLYFYSEGEAAMIDVPQNQRDYFIQLLALY
ncbi:MAG: hypothetical protein RL164_1465 [Bacteroidota bacterium]|jgi:hypothetical protein